MTIAADTFELATYRNPFTDRAVPCEMREGVTVAQIVRDAGIDPRFMADVQVTISRGVNAYTVPMSDWGKVRPKAGSHVLVHPREHGPAAPLLLSVLLPHAASYVAGTIFALKAGTLAYALTYAAVTIVGALMIKSLIPPPAKIKGLTQDDPNFSITGSSNAENRYGVYPTVLGRHRMYPPKTARGYTEGEGENIYFRGRFTFGHGIVALETLKIGTTPITEFEDVEIETLNIHMPQTLANMPELGPIVRAEHYSLDENYPPRMSLYPDDIAEDGYFIKLSQNIAVVRATRDRAISVSVDVTYPGLVMFDAKGTKQNRSVEMAYRFRRVGETDWTDAGTETHTGKSTAQLRFTKTIGLPAEGEYDIEVTRLTEDSDASTVRDEAYLSAIRSVQAGSLPTHPFIAEIAVRIKASDQLNGQIEALNAVVQQMVHVWDGDRWLPFQPVRHPAWLYAWALTGPCQKSPVSFDRVQLEDLRSWAEEEPDWTCDAVIDQVATTAEILDLICATGRARRTLRDLKYSIIRDGGAGPVVQQFSPRNSWGFTGSIIFPKVIHGFRVRCLSERLEWEQDEITVYADGYDAFTATEFETLELRGVVLPKNDESGGNAWRLGRYHLAQAVLRTEEFTWECDLEHLRVSMGDKVRLVHDVPLIGVGSGRVRQVMVAANGSVESLELDEFLSTQANAYRLCVRRQSGEELVFRASPPPGGVGSWSALDTVIAEGVTVGDLVSVEELTQESMEVLVKSIRHGHNMTATLTGVPAAPAVLQADQGEIPAYVPNIRRVHTREDGPPEQPLLLSSDVALKTNPVRLVLEGQVYRNDRFNIASYLAVLVDPNTGAEADRMSFAGTAFSLQLPEIQSYDLKLLAIDQQGRISPPFLESFPHSAEDEVPPNVEDFQIRVIGDQARLTWSDGGEIVSHSHIKHLPPGASGGWNDAVDVVRDATGHTVSVPALPGRYMIKAVSVFGYYSPDPTVVTSTILSLANYDLVRDVALHPAFEGTLGDGLYRDEGGVVFEYDPNIAEAIYESATITDLGACTTSRVSATVEAFGLNPGALSADMDLMVDVGLVAGNVNDTWRIRLQVSTTEDDPSSGAARWSAWSDLLVGDYLAWGFKFRVIFQSFSNQVSVVLRGVSVQMNVPERAAVGSDIPCPSEGVYVPFSPPFLEKPAILIRGQSLPLAHEQIVTDKTGAGFHIRYLDGDGTGIACSFDFEAKGYGHLT